MTAGWLVTPGGVAGPLRLVCLPHAGGGPNAYRGWRPFLDASITFQIVQYPGRDGRIAEPPRLDLDGLIVDIAAELARTDADFTRTVLFGHSLGAMLAHEVALHLEAVGDAVPTRLILSAREAPSRCVPVPGGPRSEADIIEAVRRNGGTTEAVLADADLMELFLGVLRADYQLVDAFRPQPDRTTAADITAIGGDADPDVGLDDLLAWRTATRGAFECQVFPGGHFYLQTRRDDVVAYLHRTLLTRQARHE